MAFCRSIYVKKVMKLLAFIFEQPSYASISKKPKFEFSRFYCIKDTFVFVNFEHFTLWQKIMIWVTKAVHGMDHFNIILLYFFQHLR